MVGGVRKRGKTWSYYFDLGKIDGKRKKKEKVDSVPKKKLNRLWPQQLTNIIMRGNYWNQQRLRFMITLTTGLITK